MSDKRRKNTNWCVGNDQGECFNEIRDGVFLAVLMDLRDELQAINRKLDCAAVQRAPYNLDRLVRALERLERRLATKLPLPKGRKKAS